MAYSNSIEQLIRALSRFPSVGRRTAERYVFYLLKSGKKDVAELTLALKQLIEQGKSCTTCWDFADTNPCALCANEKRKQDILCIVAEPQDRHAIEQAGIYTGRYHILRGTLRADNPKQLQFLKITSLLDRLKEAKEIKEVVLALNPDIDGEQTMMYLERQIQEQAPHIRITRLARGLPMGSDIRYADEMTLGSAFQNRRTVNSKQ